MPYAHLQGFHDLFSAGCKCAAGTVGVAPGAAEVIRIHNCPFPGFIAGENQVSSIDAEVAFVFDL